MSVKRRTGAGRPPVEIDVAQVEKLASRWLTKDAIADIIGCGRTTLYKNFQERPELEEAYERGRASLQARAMDWAIQSAQQGNVRARLFLVERICGLDGRPKPTESIADTARDVRDALKAMVATEVPITRQDGGERQGDDDGDGRE